LLRTASVIRRAVCTEAGLFGTNSTTWSGPVNTRMSEGRIPVTASRTSLTMNCERPSSSSPNGRAKK
jgi:hypothetical protein